MAANFLERADIEDITIHKAVDLNHGECKGEKDNTGSGQGSIQGHGGKLRSRKQCKH